MSNCWLCHNQPDMTPDEILSVAAVKREFSRLLEAAERGQRTVILRHGRPVAADEQFTSAITLGELLFGALRRQRGDLLERIQAIADTVPVLPFHEPAARMYAELRAELERRGTPLAEPDLLIAAIAQTFNLV